MNKLFLFIASASFAFAFTDCSKKEAVYCHHGNNYKVHDLCVLNNQWGAKYATNSDRFQCINSNDILVTYKWAGSFSRVKGMPVVMAGWHYGNPGGWMTPYGTHNLPSRISENKTHNVRFSETHTNKGTYHECLNCCVDIWLSDSSRGGNNGEIMVWGNYINQQPLGTNIGSFNEYEVWKGDAGGWTCVTFRKSGNWNVLGPMNTFINYTVSQGWFGESMYVTGIECGNEIMQGEGSFRVDTCAIQ